MAKGKRLFRFEKPVRRLKRTNFGYRTKRKFKREFGEKEYIRVGEYRIKSIVDKVKDKYHNRGYNALIVTSGRNYQLWIRRRDE